MAHESAQATPGTLVDGDFSHLPAFAFRQYACNIDSSGSVGERAANDEQCRDLCVPRVLVLQLRDTGGPSGYTARLEGLDASIQAPTPAAEGLVL